MEEDSNGIRNQKGRGEDVHTKVEKGHKKRVTKKFVQVNGKASTTSGETKLDITNF